MKQSEHEIKISCSTPNESISINETGQEIQKIFTKDTPSMEENAVVKPINHLNNSAVYRSQVSSSLLTCEQIKMQQSALSTSKGKTVMAR